ncbi:MAG: hypothetical protein H6702_08585, partial [Myxococcales bacterium]|nr:hypothetical protein [Myxococcales bacterium]
MLGRRSHAWIVAWTLGALGAVGCAADPEETGPGLPDLGPSLDAGARTVPVTLQLVDQVSGRPSPGTLRLRITPLGGLDRRLIDVARDADGRWPAELQVDVPPGPTELMAFVDRDGDGLFDGCPFPPSAADPLIADTLDNHHGRWRGDITAGQTVAITLERRLCGPGDAATGLMGVVRPPEGAPQISAPVYARLAATAVEGEVAPAPLILPLFPDGLAGITPFAVGELVPGPYSLTVFADDDGDGLPTPCGAGLA